MIKNTLKTENLINTFLIYIEKNKLQKYSFYHLHLKNNMLLFR